VLLLRSCATWVRVSGRDEAARFSLEEGEVSGQTHTVATGASLVQRALEDRAQ